MFTRTHLVPLFLPALALAAGVRAQAPSPPVLLAYPFLCPTCNTEQMITLRYGADAGSAVVSVAETHATSAEPGLHPNRDATVAQPGEWIASPRTGGRPGRIQRWEGEVGTDFIEVQLHSPLVEGRRYAATRRLTPAEEKPGKASWRIDDVTVTVARGADDRTVAGYAGEHRLVTLAWTRTEFDRAGKPADSAEKSARYALWTTTALPFSPLPYEYEPFKGNHVKPWLSGPVADHLMGRLTAAIEPHGGLLRAEVAGESGTTLVLSSSLPAPDFAEDRFASLPVVSSARVDAFAGPLFMTSLLRDGMLGGIGTAKLTIGDRELTGRSAWKVNEAGDLVIALAATGENTTVLLVRPVAGLPSPGQHGVTARPDTGALRAMDDAALLAHAARFQLYGVATGRRLPTVLTGFEAGDVVLERVDDNVLAGSVSGLVKTLPTQRAGQGEVLAVELAFEAAEGLEDFRFRSPESRFQ